MRKHKNIIGVVIAIPTLIVLLLFFISFNRYNYIKAVRVEFGDEVANLYNQRSDAFDNIFLLLEEYENIIIYREGIEMRFWVNGIESKDIPQSLTDNLRIVMGPGTCTVTSVEGLPNGIRFEIKISKQTTVISSIVYLYESCDDASVRLEGKITEEQVIWLDSHSYMSFGIRGH